MTPRVRSLPRDCALLLLLALAPAVLSAWLHPKRPNWTWNKPAIEQVELATVSRWPAPVLWVDARSAAAYEQGHIPGAILLNETEWERLLPTFIETWGPATRVIVYCDTQACDASDAVARRLRRELNLDEIFVLKGGWATWQQTHP